MKIRIQRADSKCNKLNSVICLRDELVAMQTQVIARKRWQFEMPTIASISHNTDAKLVICCDTCMQFSIFHELPMCQDSDTMICK